MRRTRFLFWMYIAGSILLLAGFAFIIWDWSWLKVVDKALLPLFEAKLLNKGAGIAVSLGCFFAVLDGYKETAKELVSEDECKKKGLTIWLWGLWLAAAVGGVMRIYKFPHDHIFATVMFSLAALVLVGAGLIEKLEYLKK